MSTDWKRETSLWWVDAQIQSIQRMTLQIGGQCRPIPLRFRQPLITTFQQLRREIEKKERKG